MHVCVETASQQGPGVVDDCRGMKSDLYHVLEIWPVHAGGESAAPGQLHVGQHGLGAGLHSCSRQAQHHILQQVTNEERDMPQEGSSKQVSLQTKASAC